MPDCSDDPIDGNNSVIPNDEKTEFNCPIIASLCVLNTV